MSGARPALLKMASPGPVLRGVGLVWKSAPGWTVLQIAVLVVQGLLPLAALYVTKLIVDAVAAAVGVGAAAGAAPGFDRVVGLIGIGALIGVAGVALRALSTLVAEAQTLRLGDHVHDVLHEKSVAIDLEYYESVSHQDRLYRTQLEAPHRPARIVNEVAQILQSGLGLAAISGLLFSFHWALAVILFIAAIPGVLVKIRHSRRLYDWTLGHTPKQRLSRYINSVLTTRDFAKEVRLFGLGDVLRERFRDLRKAVRDEKMRLIRSRAGHDLVAQSVGVVAVFGSFLLIGREAFNGDISIGDMVMFFGAFQRGQDFLRELLGGFAGIYEDNLFLRDLDTFLQLEPVLVEPAAPRPFPVPIREGIVLENVRFRYPGGARDVLEDVCLEIRPGEHVALVGENGSGKTTLVKLLCRLYDPTAGSVRVDGIDLRELAKNELRREIGVIFQDFARFDLSARDNIWFGNVELARDDPRITVAARQSGADELIRRLPASYDSMLGRQFEGGTELSLGEWQKIALARGLVRESGVIILDEPTASLDPRSEAEVFEHFHALARGRTAILISHRLSTVRMADRIVVLKNGRIVEAGAHDELLERGGTYSELFELQARYYR